jgi:outer membrane protein OmpA-like peptidoglycan-associated protein
MKNLIFNAVFMVGLLIGMKPVLSVAQNVEFEKENFNYKDNKDEFKAAKKAFQTGNELFEKGSDEYSQALPYFYKAQKFNPNNAFLNYKIGVCLLNSIYKVSSITYFEKAFQLNPNIDPRIHYMLGQAYQLTLNWETALKEYTTYKNSLSKEELMDVEKTIAKKMQECHNGEELMKHPVRVFIDNLETINTKFPEYTATIAADESMLYFTSRRDVSLGAKEAKGTMKEEDYDEDIYVAYNMNRKWTPAQNLGEPINTITHDATVSLSPDGQRMFIYKGDRGGDIYECVLKGTEWSKPVRLNKNINTDFHESSACYAVDQKSLYFVSDKPGGLGGRDIYMSQLLKKDKWGEPVNLGPVINTPFDEESVFMHPDGKTMYFSSKGHNSMGGYDIFKTIFNDSTKTWSKPENIGYPINTADDDAFFVVSANGRHGYYASIKEGGKGDMDLYVVTFLGPEKPGVMSNEDNLLASSTAPVAEKQIEEAVPIKTNQLTIFKGKVIDAITQEPVEATIEITDNQKNELVSSFTSNSKTGRYLIALPSGKNYGIAVKAENYLFHSENFDIPNTSVYQEINKDIQLKKIAVGSKIILKNIFFDFDKATLRKESTAELERLIALLNEVGSLRIELSGHTDNKGAAAYNQKLSEDRARAVVDYLVKKGINASRLESKGYGMTSPVAGNDTDEGRQQNRRTEFKILSK